MRKTKMNAKKLMVSFLTVMSVLLIVSTVSASSDLVDEIRVTVNGVNSFFGADDISVEAGETLTIEVFYRALENASNVRIEADLEGQKVDAQAKKRVGDLEEGFRYSEVLTITVPYELQDEVSDDLSLNIKIFNSDFRTDFDGLTLRVQRPAYNAAVMLVQTNSKIIPGESMSIDVVLKNVGYNNLDDTYVTVRVPALGLEKTDFFGDLVALESEDADDNDNEDDTTRRRIFLSVPYDTPTGVYALEVEAKNDDMNVIQTKQIFVENQVPDTVIKSGNGLIVINPTNNVKVYTIIPESPATVSDSVVVVPAGSSKAVTVDPNTSSKISVNVLSGDKLVGTVEFSGSQELRATNNDPVVVLTIVLAIIFVVLVVVLLVLLTRKPEQTEEFGESYY
jgi:hypothetical protein